MDGDVYQSVEDQEEYWLTTEDGDRLVQDFGEFFVSIAASKLGTHVRSHTLYAQFKSLVYYYYSYTRQYTKAYLCCIRTVLTSTVCVKVTTVDLIEPDPDCDCTNDAREWYKDLMRTNLLDLGVSGWMADFGEYTPTEARSAYANAWWGEQDQEEILHQIYSQVVQHILVLIVVFVSPLSFPCRTGRA